jgi:RNA polymerase sigma-70 factor (ECF subfamily)
MTNATKSNEPLRSAFLDALPPDLRAPAAELAPSSEALAGIVAAARAAWPGVRLADAAFVRHIAARVGKEAPTEAGLARLCTSDLYLACACLAGDAAALAAFDRLLGREVDVAWARIDVPAADASDARQQLRARLLVAEAERPARLEDYGGRGDLKGWLRVIAVREALQLRRKHGREAPLGEHDLLALPATADPELARMKELYRGEFQEAFRGALAELGSRERNLLRSHFLHGLGIDDLAPMFGVHRATAARWLVKVQDQLHDKTLEHLSSRLRLSGEELESVMRLIRSQLDVSVRQALGAEEGERE